jgi:hypothetical protein
MGTGRGRGPGGASAWRSECLRFEGSRGAKHGAYPKQNKKPIVQRILFRCDGGCLCCSRREEQRRFPMAGTKAILACRGAPGHRARSWLKQLAGQSRGGRWGVRRLGPGLAKNNMAGWAGITGHTGIGVRTQKGDAGSEEQSRQQATWLLKLARLAQGQQAQDKLARALGNGGRPPFPAPTVGFGGSGARHASTWAQSCFLGPNKDVQSAASALAQPLKSPHFSLSPAGRSPDAPPIKHPVAKSLPPLWPCTRHGLRPRESEE